MPNRIDPTAFEQAPPRRLDVGHYEMWCELHDAERIARRIMDIRLKANLIDVQSQRAIINMVRSTPTARQKGPFATAGVSPDSVSGLRRNSAPPTTFPG